MHVSIYDVTKGKMQECDTKFKDKCLSSGVNDEGLYNLTFIDVAIHSTSNDGLAIHNKEAITYLDNTDFSIIKIL